MGFHQPQPKQYTRSGKNGEFTERASAPQFVPGRVPVLAKRPSYNDDLRLGSFTQRKLVWADVQKKGLSPAITDPFSYSDHIIRAVQSEFPLGAEIPLHEELKTSLDWISTIPPPEVAVKFWGDQLGKLTVLVNLSMGDRQIWNDSIPGPLRQAGGKIQAVALHQLTHFNLGVDKWISQLIFGFPTTGAMSQVGVFPHSDKAKPPISPQMLWGEFL